MIILCDPHGGGIKCEYFSHTHTLIIHTYVYIHISGQKVTLKRI